MFLDEFEVLLECLETLDVFLGAVEVIFAIFLAMSLELRNNGVMLIQSLQVRCEHPGQITHTPLKGGP